MLSIHLVNYFLDYSNDPLVYKVQEKSENVHHKTTKAQRRVISDQAPKTQRQ